MFCEIPNNLWKSMLQFPKKIEQMEKHNIYFKKAFSIYEKARRIG